MAFKGRTVLALILLAMFSGSILTLTVVSSYDSSLFSRKQVGNGTQAEGPASDSKQASQRTDAGTLTAAEIDKIKTTFELIGTKFVSEPDRQSVVDGAITGMLASLKDPYTVYMDKEEAQGFTESVEATFSGIGAEVTMEDGRVTVIAPIKGSPAERAGIHAKDVIISVNGEKLDGLKLNEAVLKIRGPKGTQAKLEVVRAGALETIQIIVVRDDIDIETIYAEMLAGEIGKIEIRQFAQNTAKRFIEELENLESQGLKGLIIDVRNDPGGYLFGVMQLVEPLIPAGKSIVQIEYRDQKVEQKLSEGTGKSYPVAVLINEGSASASEILAAAMKQSAGSTLVGQTTFGKGTVQTPFDNVFNDGSNIKMTIAKWLTPDGTWIHEQGIAPDIEVSLPAYFRVAPIAGGPAMKQDDTGENVKSLQVMLEALGLHPERTDGYFSKQTAESVRKFQSSHQLPVTGEVDEPTVEKLEEEIITMLRDPANDTQLKAAIEHLQRQMK